MNKQYGLLVAAVAAGLTAPAYAVSISGAVEVETSMAEDYAGITTSDIVVATAAVGMDAELNDRVSAHVAFLYEEDETPFGVDEGYLTAKLTRTTSLVAGRMYVPFGNFESNMVSDPLTLELGETSETALMLAMAKNNLSGSIYTFNGDADENTEIASGDDAALSYGANIAFSNDAISLGASYISNLADSDGLSSCDRNLLPICVKSAVPAVGVNFSFHQSNLTLIAEHVATTSDFSVGDLAGAITNKKSLQATNVEAAIELQGGITLAGGYQVSAGTAFLGLPKKVASVTVSFEPLEGLGMGIEYAFITDYDTVDPTDSHKGDTANVVTAQLAVEF